MNCFRARSVLGSNSFKYQKEINVPTMESNDLFHLSLKKNADLLISDAHIPKIGRIIPSWHKELFPKVQSFMILPLVTNNKTIGLLYANRELKAPEGITTEETKLIKLLKGQLLTAFNIK